MFRGVAVDLDKDVSGFDAGALPGAALQHPMGAQAAVGLKPGHSIDREFALSSPGRG